MGFFSGLGKSITGAVSGIADGFVGEFFQKRAEKRAQSDRIYEWNLQNQYNDPKAQMERLKKAGLNPNLVYGNGADVTASPIHASSGGGVNFNGFSDAADNYFNTKERQEEKEKAEAIQKAQEARAEKMNNANVEATNAQALYYKSMAEKNIGRKNINYDKRQMEDKEKRTATYQEKNKRDWKNWLYDTAKGFISNYGRKSKYSYHLGNVKKGK